MSNKRDDMWKRRQSWLHLSKHPEPERTDFWNILRLVAEEPRWAKNIDPACKAFSLDSTNPIDRTLLLGILTDDEVRAEQILSATHQSLRKRLYPI